MLALNESGESQIIRVVGSKGRYFSAQVDVLSSEYLSNRLMFPVDFQLRALVSHGCIDWQRDVTRDLVIFLQEQDEDVAEAALMALGNSAQHEEVIVNFFEEIKHEVVKQHDPIKLNENLMLPMNQVKMRRITVTPTKVYLHGPYFETTNRISRKRELQRRPDSQDPEMLLKVYFCDEDLRPLMGGRSSLDPCKERIKSFLNGFNLCGRNFEFLSYSQSQLRSNGCYFIDSEQHSAATIMSTIGVFSGITNPAKLGSRMALALSSTVAVGTIPKVTIIDDVWRNGFLFSDGVGRMGRTVAETVRDMLKCNDTPSAIQFRAGGSKGVLCLHHDAKLTDTITTDTHNQFSYIATANSIQIRKSQIKFPSHDWTLEVFLELKNEMLTHWEQSALHAHVDVLHDNDSTQQISTAAVARSKAYQIFKAFDGHEYSFILYIFVLLGIYFCLDALCLKQKIQEIQRSGQIFVEKSANLMGVMDETCCLPQDCIFVQILSPKTGRLEVITGPVIIARSPSLHPGDIRMVNAIDVKDQVSWDHRLFFKSNAKPMDFEDNLSPYVSYLDSFTCEVNDSDTKKHFLNMIGENKVGLIANAWKVWTDKSPVGAFDERAIKLADLHSKAVDVAKTGVSVHFPDNLRPREYPDFMNKGNSKLQYKSNKALGELWKESSFYHLTIHSSKIFLPLTQFEIEGSDVYQQSAKTIKNEYDIAITQLLAKFSIGSELELFCGLFLKELPKPEHKSQAIKEMTYLKKRFRKKFFGSWWPDCITTEVAFEFEKKVDAAEYLKREIDNVPWAIQQK
ncbi:Protein rrf1, partial [Blyttiomyces sp. JEL0837]